VPRQHKARLETDLLVRARIREKLWVACARILRLALQVLSVVGEGRVGVFQVRCHHQSTHDRTLRRRVRTVVATEHLPLHGEDGVYDLLLLARHCVYRLLASLGRESLSACTCTASRTVCLCLCLFLKDGQPRQRRRLSVKPEELCAQLVNVCGGCWRAESPGNARGPLARRPGPE
jgi:hypothetical protein